MNEQAVNPGSDNSMALASMIVGIVSIVASCCCCGGIILGSLAVVLACMSRVEPYFEKRAKIGLACGVIGIILGIIVGFVFLMVMSQSVATQVTRYRFNFY